MKLKTFLFSLLILTMSCSDNSSDTENINDEQNNNQNDETDDETDNEEDDSFKFMVKMIDEDEEIQVEYENDLMTVFDEFGLEYTMKYNENNKVIAAQVFTGEELGFIYKDGKLDYVDYINWIEKFNYDSKGNIISVIENVDDLYDESNYITYDQNGNVLTYTIGLDGITFTFEFDDKTNPFYPIWKKYGFIIDLDVAPYDIIPMFFKHNPKKIYKDNVLSLEANYTYDSEGYPLSCGYKKYSNGSVYEGYVEFQYLN